MCRNDRVGLHTYFFKERTYFVLALHFRSVRAPEVHVRCESEAQEGEGPDVVLVLPSFHICVLRSVRDLLVRRRCENEEWTTQVAVL